MFDKLLNLIIICTAVAWCCWIIVGGGRGDADIIRNGTCLAGAVVTVANAVRVIRRRKEWL